ncbi:vacuolar protein sorting 25-like protein [Phyllostomus discolor]|uniref:Vacuolar protein-sorting-associated protein 25 n=1 Tax=Phyllostomus discolor TaxID=89673 RepID=A0A833ZSR7_9CHIR|nr:vacuolar protein sorting 25-like protein [Phyllostomus discolor]
MTVMEAQESPLFNNVKLQRKLPVESIQIVLEELRKKGNLEWLDKNKSSFLIMWRRPEEWGKLIYQWVRLSCCRDKCVAKENCIGAQQIPGLPRSGPSKVVGGGWGGRQRKCRYSRQDSFGDLISMAAQKSPFFACTETRGYMRPCLENAVLGTMSTIVGWSLWPQKINEERKEKTTTKKMGPLPLIPIQGCPQ